MMLSLFSSHMLDLSEEPDEENIVGGWSGGAGVCAESLCGSEAW